MKTTIDIPDSLWQEAKKVAALERTTLKALVAEGFRRIVSERQKKAAFRLRQATFHGQGLKAQLADACWEQVRELAYQDVSG